MYKCKECGTEYETKPDYCDCGNDTFEEILPEPPAPKNDVTNVTKLNKAKEAKEEKIEVKPQKNDSQVETPKKMEPQKTVQYDYSRLKQFFDPISTTIFCLCVVLSILIVLFAGNSLIKEGSEKSVETSKQTQNLNIPDIDNLWNSTPPTAPIQTKKVEEEPTQQAESEPLDLSKNVLIPETKKQDVKQPNKPKTQTQTTPKQNTQKTTQQKQAQPKTIQTQTAKQSQSQAQISMLMKQEVANYKTALRNRMASRMDFTKIVGDGECIVAFKVDASGRLVNRSFARQSDNDSLNDVVYNAVMQTPTFSAPPKGYKGETLHLKVRMYSNNYEVYLY